MAKEGDSILRFEIDIRSKSVIRSSVRGDTTLPFKTFFIRYMSGEPFSSLDENFSYEIIDSYLSGRENHVALFPFDNKNGALLFTFLWMRERPDMLVVNVTELNGKAFGSSLHSVDSLTGLYARSHMMTMVNSHIRKHSPFNKCGFVLVDINDFKHINDTYGHKVGDECLKAFAAKLREVTSNGIIGRYGGDEFVIFLDDTNEQDLIEVAKNTLATNITVKVGYKTISIGCCCGLSIMNYSAAEFSILLQQADKSLRLAKGNNKKEAYMDSKLVARVNQDNIATAETERKRASKGRLYKDESVALKIRYIAIAASFTLLSILAFGFISYSLFFEFRTQIHDVFVSRPALHALIHSTLGFTILFAVMIDVFCCGLYKSKVNGLQNKFIDPWTGGLNMNRFIIDAPQYIADSKEYALVQFNIVSYKSILDYIGKEKSDLLIVGVYNTIMGALDESCEIVARNYGDRFVAIVKSDSYEHLHERINSIKTSIETYVSLTYSMSANVVVGVYYPEREINDIESAVSRSDLALTHVDREFLLEPIVRYKDEMLLQEVSETDFFNRAKRAMLDGNFGVAYQAKKDIVTNQWVGVEALFRWNDPNGGELNDTQIIPLLEKNGMIIDLDLFVFKRLVEDMSSISNASTKRIPMSFNVSARHLAKSDWLDEYKKIIRDYQVDASLLEFEITESAFRASEKSVAEAIEQIHKIGAKVALDDFGKGYSSLNMIRTLDFDIIKLDGSYFVKENTVDERAKKLIKHLVDLCKDLNKSVVFEKVNSKVVADALKAAGIINAQGFYFCKPQTREQIVKTLNLKK